MLNLVAHELFPGKYNSDFAMQITSNIPDAQQYAANFANNNLGGHTRFLDGYKSSKARVCVTVGMMTTGYDCRDILNLCLMRPIFSPTDFIQIKGRGTRRFSFAYHDGHEEKRQEKISFKLFDFFANCEYFEEKFNYDEVLKLPRPKAGDGGADGPPPPTMEGYESGIHDPLKTLQETAIDVQGMRVDREFFGTFVEKVKAVRQPDLQALYDEGKREEVKRFIWTEIFDKPAEYFNLEKLRKALKLDRRVALGEIIDHVFGGTKIRSRDEFLEQECANFIAIYKPASDEVLAIKNFLKAYVADPEFRKIIDKKDYAALNAYAGFTVPELRSLGRFRDVIPEYVRDYIHLNAFA
jgi:type I restriction enzyme R subunit